MSFIENKISRPTISIESYLEEYKLSIDSPKMPWDDKAHPCLIKKFSTVKETFNDDVYIKWFNGGL